MSPPLRRAILSWRDPGKPHIKGNRDRAAAAGLISFLIWVWIGNSRGGKPETCATLRIAHTPTCPLIQG